MWVSLITHNYYAGLQTFFFLKIKQTMHTHKHARKEQKHTHTHTSTDEKYDKD